MWYGKQHGPGVRSSLCSLQTIFCCCVCCLVAKSCLTLATPWTVARQVPLSLGFPRQEYWSGKSFLSPGDLPDPGIESTSPALAGRFFTTELLGKLFFGFLVFFTLCYLLAFLNLFLCLLDGVN